MKITRSESKSLDKYIFEIMILTGTTILGFFLKRVKMQYEVEIEYGHRLLYIVYCVTCADIYVCLKYLILFIISSLFFTYYCNFIL